MEPEHLNTLKTYLQELVEPDSRDKDYQRIHDLIDRMLIEKDAHEIFRRFKLKCDRCHEIINDNGIYTRGYVYHQYCYKMLRLPTTT